MGSYFKDARPVDRDGLRQTLFETYAWLDGIELLTVDTGDPDGDGLDSLVERFIGSDPGHPGLVVASGGSGHGFKFAPLLGDWIADAVEGLSGLIVLGNAWESVDIFHALSYALQIDGRSSLAQLASACRR